jgi:hypothetical protein
LTDVHSPDAMTKDQSQQPTSSLEALLRLICEIPCDEALKITAPDGWTIQWVPSRHVARGSDRSPREPFQRLLEAYHRRQTPWGRAPTTGDVTDLRLRDDVDGWKVRWRRADGERKKWRRREATGVSLDEACTAAAEQIEST